MDHRVLELAEKIYARHICIATDDEGNKDRTKMIYNIAKNSMSAAQVFYDVNKKDMFKVKK